MKLRVAITGGHGRLGRFVTAALAAIHDVRVLDQTGGPTPPGVESRVVDVRDLAAVQAALEGIEAVVHLAAIDRSVPAPDEDVFRTNVLGTWNVMHASEQAGVRRVLFCSSTAASGLDHSNPKMPPLYLPVDEAHPLRPADAYGLSKRVGEAIAEAFVQRGRLEVLALRPAFIAFPESLGFMRGGGTMGGDRSEPLPYLRAYVSPEDCARAFLAALELHPYRGFEAFYITADDSFAEEPTVRRLETLYGATIAVRDTELYRHAPRASVFSNGRAKQRLGWRPGTRWEARAGLRPDPPGAEPLDLKTK